jgi:hypothetical protein
MQALIPVNLSAEQVAAQPDDGEATVTLPEPPAASTLANWQQESYSLDLSAAASLGFPVGAVTGSYTRHVMLFGASRWADITANGHTYRFGVALRALVIASDIKGSANLTLPAIAAKVEIEGATATAQMLVRGYTGDLGSHLPQWESFGVDSYAAYMKSISDIQQTIMSDTANIAPELIATTVVSPPTPSAADAVGVV